MVNLPLLRSLDVTGYGLYPGDDSDNPSLHVRFLPGLTLVLGANGLGKTTLVTMLYRLLTGPYDLRAFTQGGDLGTASREVIPLRGSPRQTFAHRVADGAVQARARLTFDVDGVEVSVERSLRDLTLLGFSIGGAPPDQEEELYQAAMASLANVSTFNDWILLLRFIVFYLEDRRALVWDPTAQRQVLRVLFLDPQHSKDWEDRERKILGEDSRVRNMQSVRSNLVKRISHVESLTVDAPRVQKELEERDRDQQDAQDSLERETSALPAVDDNYERARHRVLTLEQDRESRYRELERARLLAVSARLPQHSDSARYILTQILVEEHCLVCGTDVPEVSRSMESRIQDDECVVCGSKLPDGSADTPIHLADARMRREAQDFHRIESDLEAARFALKKSEEERGEVVTAIQGLRVRIADNSARIEQLVQRLPPADREQRQQRYEYSSIQAEILEGQEELVRMRSEIESVIASATAAVLTGAEAVKESFATYASDFLVEDCRLEWSPQSAPLGQTGRLFKFPAFQLALGGSDFSGPIRRGGPADVSESQREFIDISFRMALAHVAASQHVTTLVMDAPESSLDAVFVGRAANVLSTFSRPETGNCLIVTSNIVDGGLIPVLLRNSMGAADRDARVVDLLTIAVPTAAVRDLWGEYQMARDKLLGIVDPPRA